MNSTEKWNEEKHLPCTELLDRPWDDRTRTPPQLGSATLRIKDGLCKLREPQISFFRSDHLQRTLPRGLLGHDDDGSWEFALHWGSWMASGNPWWIYRFRKLVCWLKDERRNVSNSGVWLIREWQKTGNESWVNLVIGSQDYDIIYTIQWCNLFEGWFHLYPLNYQ